LDQIEATMPSPVNAVARTDRGSALAEWSWILADAARGPHIALITLFIFSAYFTTTVIGDPVRGQALWGYISSAGAVVLAIGAPLAGAMVDAGGRRKPWLAACLCLAVPAMAALWFATPFMSAGGVAWIVAALLLGAIGLQFSGLFHNALLPVVTTPQRVGTVSGLGVATTNAAIVVVLLFFLLAWSWNDTPLFGFAIERLEPQRATGPLVAIWLVVFTLPLFLFAPDAPRSSLSTRAAVKNGLVRVMGTFRTLRDYPNVATFLVARMAYNEGFIILGMSTGIFAAGVLHWTPAMLIVQGLINSVCGVCAGLATAWLDRKIGTKVSTILFVVGALLANIALCSVTATSVFFIAIDPVSAGDAGGLFPTAADKLFLVANIGVAVFMSAGMGSSRTMIAKLAPSDMIGEFFALFALTATVTSFIGPLLFGLMTSYFQSQRAGLAVGVVFLIVGLLVMFLVKEPEISADVK